MQPPEVKIEELILQVSGYSEQEAERLGKEVVSQLSERLPSDFRKRQINNLELKISIKKESSMEQMREEIVEAILNSLM